MRSPTDEEDSENEENYQSCSDDAEDVKTAPHSSQRRFKKETMRDVLISMVLLGLTTLVTHGDFQTSPTASILASGPRTRTSRAPNPLFGGAESFVDDYFTGDIFSAFEEADQYENALLMFYAPWDADCTRAKEILEVVAKTFVDNDIYFAAVNCWEGQCNTEFNTSGGGGGGKPSKNPRLSQHQYPIFIFYPKDRRGIQYNGPISVQAMLDFLLVARKPLVHLGSRTDLLNLRANHGGRVLVGYFPDLFASLKSRKVWRKFLDASYTFLEQDPFQNSIGGMGVVTSQNVALTLQLDASRPIRYFFTNGSSVAYPNKTISSTQSLMSWTRHHQVNHPSLVTWIGTAGRKSLNLARKLENNSKHSLLVFLNRKHRRSYNEAFKAVQDLAVQYFTCDVSLFEDASNLLRAMHEQQKSAFMTPETRQCLLDPWFIEYFPNFVSEEAKSQNRTVKPNKDFLLKLPKKFSPLRPLVDPQVVELKRMSERLDCSLMASTAGEDSQNCDLKDVFDEYSTTEDSEAPPFVWGLGCRDNRTLNFYVLDSLTQWSLRQKLGILDEDQAALILSLHEEKIYKMKKSKLNRRNLQDFLVAFHQDPNSLSTLKLSTKSHNQSSNEIEEIHAGNFVERLVNSKRTKPVVLLYKTESCGFCTVATHVFHTLKRLISSDLLDFVTVQAGQNDLPWAFTALAVPSVLYFPPGTQDSRAFPMEKRLSVPNLLSFIVANLDGETRVKLAMSICADDCLQEVRVELAKKGFQNEKKGTVTEEQDFNEVNRLLMTNLEAKNDHHDEL